ncbi:OB-fold domain-containing protein [Tepidiforma flava]|uniref:OB-fold domain-containing protein n=1 Tax=Tepidiforma flava TaxID=3004094 RepID=A0ABY7M604_9CHLR|nr:OB-fold domain-containing protein [Tepidiforma flava]WBL35939.1 OB-fold domain-containing protein [Tepidiforma flava]
MPDRPQPRFPEPDTQPYWEATKDHRLLYQVDRDTGDVVFFPRRHNPKNGSSNLEWRESKGLGTVYTFSVVRLNRHPAFAELGPYAVAYVDLDEGFRILTNIVGVQDPTKDIYIGQRVKVAWLDQSTGISIPVFEPA